MPRLALTVLLTALCIGCSEKTPLGPGAVTVSRSTSTTTSTTTSTIPPSTTADFIFSPLTPAALEVVSFNAFGSTAAPGKTIVTYNWDFGDGQSKTGVSVTHDFFPQGLYIVTLTVTDSAGAQAKVSKPIGAGVPLPPTTTTSIPTNTQVHYVNSQAAPNIPADLTLFFQLLTTVQDNPSARTRMANLAGLSDLTFGTLADSSYGVRGVYSTLNGGTGTVDGLLVGTLTPAPSGTFTGSLTANMPGCTAKREFSGSLTSGSLNWTAGNMVSNTCGTNPLDFPSMVLLKSDTPSPIPLPTTTTTTSVTTTSVLCNYSLSPVSVTLEARGPGAAGPPGFQTSTVGITTTAGCGWTMQTDTPWITLLSPTLGTGSATVSFQVADFLTCCAQQRVGSIVIAGITFLVNQNSLND